VTPTASYADTVDWAALCRTARKIAARYIPPQDVDDIVQNALLDIIEKNKNGKYDPARASRQTYLMVSLRYAVLGAISAYVYGSYDLGYEECREAFRKWDGADPADIVATLTARYITKGYSKATASQKAQRIATAIGDPPPEQTMPPEWWAHQEVTQ
jgi:DNA-directed RNA polymerase specialized sigma24 family protein